MSLLNVSVDSGYGYVLGSSILKETKFSSYIKKIEGKEVEEYKKNIKEFSENSLLIKYDNEYYMLGKMCEKTFSEIKRTIVLNNRIKNTNHLVEILTAISLITEGMNDIAVNLMMGLPMTLTDKKKDCIEWLKNKKYDIVLVVNDREIKKHINIKNVECAEQPVFPIFCIPDNEKEKTIISIDLGHNTCDTILWTDYEINRDTSIQSLIRGVIKCYNKLESELMNRFEKLYVIPEKSIQLAIETGYFVYNGKKTDISEQLDKVFGNYAQYIFEEIERRYDVQLNLVDMIMLSGGIVSNQRFLNHLTKLFKDNYNVDVACVEEPQWAVARGMLNLLNDVYKDDFEEETAITKEEIASDEE